MAVVLGGGGLDGCEEACEKRLGGGTWEKENGTRSRVEERGGRERCSPSPLPCLCLECPLQPSLGAEKPRAPLPLPPPPGLQ